MRRSLAIRRLVCLAGPLLAIFSIRPDLQQWYRTVELLTTVPVLIVLAARMLAMFEAVVGVFYVAAVVAVFVGTYSSQRRTTGTE